MAVRYKLFSVVFVCSILLGNCSPSPHDVPIRKGEVDEAKLDDTVQALKSYVDLAIQPLKQEIANLKSEMADMRNKHAVEIKHLREELDILTYALGQSDKHTDLDNEMLPAVNKTAPKVPLVRSDKLYRPLDMETKASIQRDVETHLQETIDTDKHNMPDPNAPRQHIRRQVDGSHTHVAFFAKLSTHAKDLGVNQHVVFDNVVTNVGNGYDKNIGVFRAPVSGTYLISTTITAFVSDKGHFGIFINLRQETWFLVNGSDNHYDSTSHTIVVHLNVGDDVTVRSVLDVNGALGQEHSILSGALLFADDEQPALVGK